MKSAQAVLTGRGLMAQVGTRSLFTGVDLAVGPGDVLGVIGANGAGKSTLLRVLSGERAPDGGAVTYTILPDRVGYFPQTFDALPHETVLEYVERHTGIARLERELQTAADALAYGATPAAAEEYDRALRAWTVRGAGNLAVRLPATLADVGLEGLDPERSAVDLSGGMRARLRLAGLMLSGIELALLDEPTNDLDIAGLELLESYVSDRNKAFVIVTHDREFLARRATQILELDRAQGAVHLTRGGYDVHVEEREIARRQSREDYARYADEVATLQDRARQHREWSGKGVARASKRAEPDKHERRHAIASGEKQARRARQILDRIDRLEEVEEPRKEWDLRILLPYESAGGSVLLTADGVTFLAGARVVGPLSVHLAEGDRIGIVGPNGAGKSTLLRGLQGMIPPETGRLSRGQRARVVVVDQDRCALPEAPSLLAAVGRLVPGVPAVELRTLLAKFGLGAVEVDRPVEQLTPGERTRALIATLQARASNLLVLDEPTNHLDHPTIVRLEAALEKYPGAVLLVTHDRRFLRGLHLTEVWEIDDDGRVARRASDVVPAATSA